MKGCIDEIQEKRDAQLKYLKDNGIPLFSPSNGICYRCGKQIYEKIDFKTASSELITGCPYCCHSFVS